MTYNTSPLPHVLGALYRAGFEGHRSLYRVGLLGTTQPGTPTLALGGMRAGGSGKTPMARTLALMAAASGARVAILSRGVGGDGSTSLAFDSRAAQHLSRGQLRSLALRVGDEAAEGARLLGGGTSGRIVWAVGRRRLDAYRLARVHMGPLDLVILDDGMHHYAVTPHVRVALASEGDLAAGTLPAGPNREGNSVLRRADEVWWRGRRPLEGEARVRWVLRPFAVATDGAELPLAEAGRCLLVAGTGAPDAVYRAAVDAGLNVVKFLAWPDHVRPTDRTLRRLADDAGRLRVVTTAKDWVKIASLWPVYSETRLWYLRAKVCFEQGEERVRRLVEALVCLGKTAGS